VCHINYPALICIPQAALLRFRLNPCVGKNQLIRKVFCKRKNGKKESTYKAAASEPKGNGIKDGVSSQVTFSEENS